MTATRRNCSRENADRSRTSDRTYTSVLPANAGDTHGSTTTPAPDTASTTRTGDTTAVSPITSRARSAAHRDTTSTGGAGRDQRAALMRIYRTGPDKT